MKDDDRKSIPGANSENMGVTRLVGAHLAGTTVHWSVEDSIARLKAYTKALTDVIDKSKSNQIKPKKQTYYDLDLSHRYREVQVMANFKSA